jgi:hypothetical protein
MLNTLNWPHVTGARFAENGTKIADGLLEFAGIYYNGWKPTDLQAIFNRGNFVDAACNLLGQGETLHPDTLQKAEKEGWDGFIDAYREFQSCEGWIMSACAQRIVNNEDRYVGTFDQLGTLRGTSALIDIKTGSAPCWTGLQLAAYDLTHRLKRYALELHADGTYRLIWFHDYLDYNKIRLLARAYWVTREYL